MVAKTEEGVWSAPSAIATVGMGWGALIGGEITDFVLVLNTEAALEAFSGTKGRGYAWVEGGVSGSCCSPRRELFFLFFPLSPSGVFTKSNEVVWEQVP